MKRLIFSFIALIYISCSNIRNKGFDEAFISIDSKLLADAKKDTTLIEDIEYIPLITEIDNPIGEINRIIYKNNKFYILDIMVTQSVMVFNEEGKFIYKISNQGRGPGEYVSISDFDVDSEGNILVFDAGGTRNIIRYRNEGRKYDILKPVMSFMEFKLLNDDKLIAYLPFSATGIVDCYGIIDIKKNKYETLVEKRDMIDDNQMFYEMSHIFKSGNSVFISPRFSNQIFKVHNEEIIKYIDFSVDLFPPVHFVENLLNDRHVFFKNDLYITSVSGIYETENTIILSVHQSKKIDLLINKESGKGYCLSNVHSCMYGGSNVLGSTGEKFISISTGLNQDAIKKSCLSSEKKIELLNMADDSSPIMVLFKVRNF